MATTGPVRVTTDAAKAPTPTLPPGVGKGPREGIWKLAWPAIVGNLLHSTVALIDIKIVGSLGASAVAAVTTGNRMFFVLQAVLMAITAGTTAMVARAWGAGDRNEAARVTRASAIACGGLSLVLTVPGIVFAYPMAAVFRLDAETTALAATFIRWLSVFNVAFALFFVVGVALRAAGDTLTPLWIGAITNVINVGLVYGLVYGEFGLPALGVQGAAIANGVSFSLGALILLSLWVGGKLRIGLGTGRSLERPRLAQLLYIGYPAAIEQAVWQAGFIAFMWIVAIYGTAPYSAYGIGVSILSFSFVVGWGFSIAASTLVGQHLGADDPEAAARSGWRALWYAMIPMVLLGGSIVATAEEISRWIIDDPEVVHYTVVFIYILGAMQPLMAVEMALGGALRGAGDTRFPLYATLVGLIGVRVALAGAFAWLGLSAEWIFAALIGDYVAKALILGGRFIAGGWKDIQVQPGEDRATT
jgi:putative MATE family efflux protein